MPGKINEVLWEKAEGIAKEEYDFKEGSPKFFQLVMKIYKDLSARGKKDDPRSKLEEVLEEKA